jgi:hypothetical protein
MGIKPLTPQCQEQIIGLNGSAVGVHPRHGLFGVAHQSTAGQPFMDLSQTEIHRLVHVRPQW